MSFVSPLLKEAQALLSVHRTARWCFPSLLIPPFAEISQVTPDPLQYSTFVLQYSTFVHVPRTSGDAFIPSTRANVSAYYHLLGSRLSRVVWMRIEEGLEPQTMASSLAGSIPVLGTRLEMVLF